MAAVRVSDTEHVDNTPSHEWLLALRRELQYAPETGDFRWLVARANAPVGSMAGTTCSKGYRVIHFRWTAYKAHRLAWVMTFGVWPKGQIDHINGIKSDNRIENLREATNGQNRRNTRISRNNTSGVRGVSYNKRWRYWAAQINVDGRVIRLGNFRSLEQAKSARESAEKIHFGEFRRLV